MWVCEVLATALLAFGYVADRAKIEMVAKTANKAHK
jgi:hypothetical protein